MVRKKTNQEGVDKGYEAVTTLIVEDVIEKRLEEVVTILDSGQCGKSTIYEEIMSMVERALIKIAMRRSGYVKTTAAAFLGINRNTLNNKMHKLGIQSDKD